MKKGAELIQEVVQRQRIEARITKLQEERTAFLNQVNAQLGGYNGAIQELEKLLAPEPSSESDGSPEPTSEPSPETPIELDK